MSTKFLSFFLLILLWGAALQKSCAQSTGTVTGTVRDARSKEPVVGASVRIDGTLLGAATDLEGHFRITGVPTGNQTVSASYLGFTKLVKQVVVEAGETKTLSFGLEEESEGRKLNEVQIVGQKRRDTDISLINEVRQASVVASGISSEQIARSVDRDAAQVVQRIPGITVQDNRFIVVRGLAQRYNQTLLNDVLAPSTEVDTRSFSFDLIPSSVLDRMIIYKSPAAEFPGDFGGGVVKLYTKSVVNENFTDLSASAGYRTQTTGEALPYSVRSGTDWLGYDNGTRSLPSGLPSNLQTSDKSYTEQIRSFKNNYALQNANATPDLRANLTIGRKMTLPRGVLTNLTSVSYSNTYTNIPKGKLERVRYDSALNYIFRYKDQIATREARIGVIHNWMWAPSNRTRYELRQFFNQQGEDETIIREGDRPSDFSGGEVFRQYAFRYTQRSLYNAQLSGTHTSEDERTRLVWTAGYNYMSRQEPDYRRFRQIGVDTALGAPKQYTLVPAASVGALEETGRFYSKLVEQGVMQSTALEHHSHTTLGDSGIFWKAGYYLEYKERTFDARFFTYMLPSSVAASPRGQMLIGLPIGQIFNGDNLATKEPGSAALVNGFSLQEGTRPSDAYKGQNLYTAAYVSAQENFGKLTAILGTRLEYNLQQLQAQTTQTPVKVSNPVFRPLPSLNLSYALSSKALLRFGTGVTLNRPEFRELAPFVYYDFQNDANYVGNPNLKTASIYNVDLRYELYPTKGETISFGVFGKHFSNPIELGISQTGGTTPQYIFLNASTATAAGAEVEIRKSLQNLAAAPWLQRFAFIFNAAYIYSQVDLGAGTVNQDRRRALQGQSPYVVNTGIYYTDAKTGWQASVIYNVSGKRIYAVGNNFFPTVYEMPRNVVDITLQKRISNRVELRASISDLLNAQYRYYQDYTRDGKITAGKDQPLIRYRRGTVFTLGFVVKL